jgi:hypothetical protein
VDPTHEKLRIRILQRMPRAVIEDPFEAFLSVLCIFAGLPLILAPPDSSRGAVARLMPGWFVRGWGLTLTVGGALVLLGLFLHGRARNGSGTGSVPVRTRGRTIERIGLIVLGYASAIYTIALVVIGGWQGVPAAAIVTAFGLTVATKAFLMSTSELIVTNTARIAAELDVRYERLRHDWDSSGGAP